MITYYKLLMINKIRRSLLLLAMLLVALPGFSKYPYEEDIEDINRGIVAVKDGSNIFVSWRLLGSEPDTTTFNLYRITEGAAAVKINSEPIDGATNFLDTDANTSVNNQYYVCAMLNGEEQEPSDTVYFWNNNYLTVPINNPGSGKTVGYYCEDEDGVKDYPNGQDYTYSANDASVADLDGDGEYEIILKWDPSNSQDNSRCGCTGNVILDAYKLDGTLLWRVDLGVNIRAGAHYTQFLAYDFDQDGKAEVACKTAPGTIDGLGNYISKGPADSADHSADYRNDVGRILSGPEYLTVFNGETGAEVTTVPYYPARGSVSSWGDGYGNRVDRFLAAVAYVDGEHPSLVMCRGYYTRTVLAAWRFNGDSLTRQWVFDTKVAYSNYAGQGNHQLSVADVDDDGKDEIIYGSMAVDDDGTGLWNTGFGHGDAMHVSDIVPDRIGLEKWGVLEEKGQPGGALIDARTGEVIYALPITDNDVGRGVSADLVPSNYGMECWGGTSGVINASGETVGSSPSSENFVIWWDGDLSRELLNYTTVSKYPSGTLLSAPECHSNNTTKATPCLQADLFGDWREEIIFGTDDDNYLRIYTTTDLTEYRIPTLMHDHTYRMAIAWQNVGYNQPPHTGFFLGTGMFDPDSVTIPVDPRGLEVVGDSSVITLNWWRTTDKDLKYFYIYRSETSDGEYIKIDSVSPENRSYEDASMELDKEYFYKIKAIDGYGNTSGFSDYAYGTPTLRPDIPTGTSVHSSDNQSIVFWDAHPDINVAGYNVYRSNSESGTYEKINPELIEGLTYTDGTFTKGSVYFYTITAVYTTGYESYNSDTNSVTIGEYSTYQAEDATLTNANIGNTYTGFYGSGYVDPKPSDGHVNFQYLYNADTGMYNMSYTYSNGKYDREGNLIVNGRTYKITMKRTGSWSIYRTDEIEIPLFPGFSNSIEFVTTNNADFGNIDQIVIGERTGDVGIKDNFAINQANQVLIAPNPFTNETVITISASKSTKVQVDILNLLGQKVADIATGETINSTTTFIWDGTDNNGTRLNSGIYLCRILTDDNNIQVSRIMLAE